jgi:hypothetical protein
MAFQPDWLTQAQAEDVGLFQGIPKWACCCLSCPFFMKRVGDKAWGESGQPVLNAKMKLHLQSITDVIGLHKTTFLCKDMSPADVAQAVFTGKHASPTFRNIGGKPTYFASSDIAGLIRTQVELAMRDGGGVYANKTPSDSEMLQWLENEVRLIRAAGTHESFEFRVKMLSLPHPIVAGGGGAEDCH